MNSQDIKNLSIFLTKNLKNKEIKQSTLLELMAQFNGCADWNTLIGVEKKTNLLPDDGWKKIVYIHISNGGYTFYYHKEQKLLKIETGFFGYSVNTHIFNFLKSDVENLIKHGEKWSELINDESRENEFAKHYFPDRNIESIFRFNEFNVIFSNDKSSVEMDGALVLKGLKDNIKKF